MIVLAVMVTGVEWYTYAHRPEMIRDYWNKFLINEHELVGRPGDFDYLILGDSIQKTGIDPRRIDASLLNLGLPGGKPMGLYLLLKRYLASHKPPKTVFIYVDPEDAHDSLFVILRFFVSIPEAMSIWGDLTPEERKIFLMRYWATLDLRKVGLTEREEYPNSNDLFVKELLDHNGYMPIPNPLTELGPDHFRKNRSRIQSKVSFDAADMKYLDKIMELAKSKGIKVVFLGFLQPKELYAIHERTGFNADYRSFYDRLKTRYPDAGFVEKPVMHMDNSYFGDSSHLNAKGSELWGGYFREAIFRPAVLDSDGIAAGERQI